MTEPWYITTGERWETSGYDDMRLSAATACWAAWRTAAASTGAGDAAVDDLSL
jgi:hypothetical protein